jgi:UDP-hydrolysing UDP-N-acetyl-D-glucosamine 2-epimerase
VTSESPTSRGRRICVVLVDRANYGRLKPVMHGLRAHPDIELSVLCAGTMVLERFDKPVELVRSDGFAVEAEVYMEVEGSLPVTMAKSLGFGVVEFAGELHRLQPDLVLLIGDRYEALAAALAAVYMNVPLVHLQGGEVSGSIDESARHAITKLAQFHYPATARSAEYLLRMGERSDTILGVGCPSGDIVRGFNSLLDPRVLNTRGSGAEIDPAEPFLLAIFHPVTTEFGTEVEQVEALLEALDQLGMPTLMLWPNIDSGSDHISKTIRVFRSRQELPWLRTITNLDPENFLAVLARAACAVGNSSSFVRDASFLGTPIVLVGSRQDGREWAEHVTRVEPKSADIATAIRLQLDHGQYPPSDLYGDGAVADRVVKALVELDPYVQKRLSFIDAE